MANETRNQYKEAQSSLSIGFLLGLLFDPEDGGDMFARNVRLPRKYMALELRRP
jgi:hypothetical protein